MVNKDQNKRSESNPEEGKNRKTADTHTRLAAQQTLKCWQHPRPLRNFRTFMLNWSKEQIMQQERQKPEAKIKLNEI